jgi:NADP-dependent 3-hydroxy acid dehydrogenase YdfG
MARRPHDGAPPPHDGVEVPRTRCSPPRRRSLRELARRGAAVAIAARRRERLDALAREIEDAGGTALAIEADVTDQSQVRRLVDEAVDGLGRLDTVVNNAGVMLLGPIEGAPIAYIVTRPRRVAVNELLIRPTEQEG